ncbi:uncharacterized protein LOC132925708 [Rhopalosiphum padi]|uniref:uncharacterized protein LOC132925708 n=1 Tax=Rhopalosiphum padi TaxID=40932 RepID=UPI00298E6692|nr:uncharacterized protein LOC132925708 [Rhopalosiphum padi]
MSISFFDDIPNTRCVSPDLFPKSYDLHGYTLRVAGPGEPAVNNSLGFQAGQRFPWESPDSRSSSSVLNLISGQFLSGEEILNDAQTFHMSCDYQWDASPPKEKMHWKKIMLLKFDLKMI